MPPAMPHVLVLFGATGDLAKRKLLPGLLHLLQAGLLPDCQIVGTSLDALDDEGFRCFARGACAQFARDDVPEDGYGTSNNVSPTFRNTPVRRRLRRPSTALSSCWVPPAWLTEPGSSWRSPSAPIS
jgi:Glucose-6-phosphate dehydrogenase, NAD binding domain